MTSHPSPLLSYFLGSDGQDLFKAWTAVAFVRSFCHSHVKHNLTNAMSFQPPSHQINSWICLRDPHVSCPEIHHDDCFMYLLCVYVFEHACGCRGQETSFHVVCSLGAVRLDFGAGPLNTHLTSTDAARLSGQQGCHPDDSSSPLRLRITQSCDSSV